MGSAVFVLLLFVTAPYGRHGRGGWGPSIHSTAAWVLMEAPAPLGMLALFALGDRTADLVPWIFLVLWEAHYLQRTFVFPFRRRAGDRRTPLVIVGIALLFNLVNAYLQGAWLFDLGPRLGRDWLLDPRFLCGVALFVAGMAINIHSDEVLRRLRKPGESGYKVPSEGLHRLVASPNYLGELMEWFGWALFTWSLGGIAFAVWTAANLVPRAISHRRWYRKTFADYPPERKALIPWVL
ncbi:MAG: DUF1295 domain-containing protein [Deltaproteobacteria bacterium]|nr:DUF1295 domain-containing protein [Deltaproteobacteria bacterium]